ncbi:MAG: PA0069 family radical SAM protein [Candidatus Omnitrophica bacterium]|nr:PA0069 family radical SAM protein [Candidatus Omnitrophota bacterium]MDE2215092.1 PA0069 family radical SAM protein [Candidatus Omnitrophota bacterium]MDE2232053.1 PA0069 family radical SAM protein [Candidatus Omnitrophota bacterium]
MPEKELHNRGALVNPVNRFERISFERDEEITDEEYPSPKTEFYKDTSQSIISYNDSPDIGFETSLNPYRGCEHGCVYCYARPTHEYFGLSSGRDFEAVIFVKTDAPALLRKELASPKWKPQVVVMSGVTDCYQPFERKFTITRQCLQVLEEFHNPVGIITKNKLVTRDVDILKSMARYQGICVTVSITTLDAVLARAMEPRASTPANRLAAVEALAAAGIPVTVNVAPIVPGLTEHEIPSILKAAARAGAQAAGYTIVRLPYAVKDIFERWLAEYFPDRKDKVLNRIRELRNGALYDSGWGSRMTGQGLFAESIRDIFDLGYKRAGFPKSRIHLSAASFCNAQDRQMRLFA